MVEGQSEYDREQRLLEELRLQDAHDEVDRLRKEQETPKKLKGKKKKKKKTPSRSLRDEQRAEQRRAEAEKLVARLEAERVERAGEDDEDDEKTDWREVAQDDLDYSDGEPCFKDPRQAAWAGLPQGRREVPKDEVVEALRSRVRAAAGPELKFRAGVETTAAELAAATPSRAGWAKKQSKVFDPGGGL
jgi:hypothetical protein